MNQEDVDGTGEMVEMKLDKSVISNIMKLQKA